MSEEELVDAYTNGDLSRRVFVRRLVTRGLSVAAALQFADALAPAVAAAEKGDPVKYPPHHSKQHTP